MLTTLNTCRGSAGINVSISSSQVLRIPLFVHDSHVALLPNWFCNRKLESPLVEIYWMAKKKVPRAENTREGDDLDPAGVTLKHRPPGPQPAIDSTLTSWYLVRASVLKGSPSQEQIRPLVIHWAMWHSSRSSTINQNKGLMQNKHRSSKLARVGTSGRFIMGWTGGSRFSADSSRYSSTVVQSSNAIEGTKSSPAGNLCAPGWWLIPSMCLTSANQSESLFLSVYPFHPVTPSEEEQRSPFPDVGRLFLDRTYQVWLLRPSLWLKRQRALRIYHATPHVSFYFRAMSAGVTARPVG